jgi:hypothetical protein
VHVLWATEGSDLASQVTEAAAQSQPLVLGENHPLARQAFVRQTSPASTAQQPV